ncbi:hypothetical protein BPAE_0002g00980 [Botrytis paeoniae]|uniref:Uncharacterized protein n=1 Tax=Botrytis paeoniae TaxID=278948 RepID=A0A4Z1G2D2_9HELO|nr:hypothetical protein BPAE_0002g00980 [Botrytis paeoniae]
MSGNNTNSSTRSAPKEEKPKIKLTKSAKVGKLEKKVPDLRSLHGSLNPYRVCSGEYPQESGT